MEKDNIDGDELGGGYDSVRSTLNGREFCKSIYECGDEKEIPTPFPRTENSFYWWQVGLIQVRK